MSKRQNDGFQGEKGVEMPPAGGSEIEDPVQRATTAQLAKRKILSAKKSRVGGRSGSTPMPGPNPFAPTAQPSQASGPIFGGSGASFAPPSSNSFNFAPQGSSGIFGSTNSGATPSTNVFANPFASTPSNPPSQPQAQSQPQQNGGLFGSTNSSFSPQVTSQPAGNMFGNASFSFPQPSTSQSTPQSNGNLFGSASNSFPPATKEGGLFGSTTNNSQQPPPQANGGVFGSTSSGFNPSTSFSGFTSKNPFDSTATKPQPESQSQPQSSGGLFGTSTAPSTNLFGTTTASTSTPSKALFGASTMSNASNTQEQPQTEPKPQFGNLFGNTSTTTPSNQSPLVTTSEKQPNPGLETQPQPNGGLPGSASGGSTPSKNLFEKNLFGFSAKDTSRDVPQSTATGGLFGAPSPAAKPSAPGSLSDTPAASSKEPSTSAAPATSGMFGKASTSTAPFSSSIFGNTSQSASTPALFGSASKDASTPGLFGSTSKSAAPSTSGPFSSNQSTTAASTSDSFGKTQDKIETPSTPNLFGNTQTKTDAPSTTNLFANFQNKTAATPTPSLFGSPQAKSVTPSVSAAFGSTSKTSAQTAPQQEAVSTTQDTPATFQRLFAPAQATQPSTAEEPAIRTESALPAQRSTAEMPQKIKINNTLATQPSTLYSEGASAEMKIAECKKAIASLNEAFRTKINGLPLDTVWLNLMKYYESQISPLQAELDRLRAAPTVDRASKRKVGSEQEEKQNSPPKKPEASVTGGLFSQFQGQKTAEELAAERKEAAKNADYDSEEEDYETWSARYDAKQAEKKAAAGPATPFTPKLDAAASANPFSFPMPSKSGSTNQSGAREGAREDKQTHATTPAFTFSGSKPNQTPLFQASSTPSAQNEQNKPFSPLTFGANTPNPSFGGSSPKPDQTKSASSAFGTSTSDSPFSKSITQSKPNESVLFGAANTSKFTSFGNTATQSKQNQSVMFGAGTSTASSNNLFGHLAQDKAEIESDPESDVEVHEPDTDAGRVHQSKQGFQDFTNDFFKKAQEKNATTSTPASDSPQSPPVAPESPRSPPPGSDTPRFGTIFGRQPAQSTGLPSFSVQQATPAASHVSSVPTPAPAASFLFPGTATQSAASSRATSPSGLSGDDSSVAEARSDQEVFVDAENATSSESSSLNLSQLQPAEEETYEVLFDDRAAAKEQTPAEPESGKGKGFVVRAKGPIWILRHRTTGKAIVRMRIPSGATPVNFNVPSNMPSSVNAKFAITSDMAPNGTFRKYYFQFRSHELAKKFSDVYNTASSSLS